LRSGITLLAVVPAREVDAADRFLEPHRELAQHVVARIVPVRVVDRLEEIDVERA
jgi:hypothetical protein